jgi:hypothetical protein
MTQAEFLARIQRPAEAWCLRVVGIPTSPEATRFLLAVAGQESACTHRAQITRSGAPGPARSFWQGELTGGMVHGVLHFNSERIHRMSRALYAASDVAPQREAIWRAIEWHDPLAYGLARLLLLTDPFPIPTTQQAAWDCYLHRLWRPGRPHPETWPGWWQGAGACLAAGTA